MFLFPFIFFWVLDNGKGGGSINFPYRHFSNFFLVCESQDVLVIKPPKKSPMLLRMAVLMFSMVCGVFIFSVCLKQISTQAKTKFVEFNVIEKPSQNGARLTNVPYLHYPKPVSFSR